MAKAEEIAGRHIGLCKKLFGVPQNSETQKFLASVR